MTKDMICHFSLGNGLRYVHRRAGTTSYFAMGLFVGAGSRHEEDDLCGLSHLVEHLVMRRAKSGVLADIMALLENDGCVVRARVKMDYSSYWVEAPQERYQEAVEFLSRVVKGGPMLDLTAIEIERNAILREIADDLQDPTDHVRTLLSGAMWPDSQLGRSTLGTPAGIANINRYDVQNYFSQFYRANNMVLCAVGDLPHHDFAMEQVNRYFSDIKKASQLRPVRLNFVRRKSVKAQYHNIRITHMGLGFEAFPRTDSRTYPLMVLSALLGGDQTTSLLWREICAPSGLCNMVSCNLIDFIDTGAIMVLCSSSHELANEAIQAIWKVLEGFHNRLTTKDVGDARSYIVRRLRRWSIDCRNLMFDLGEQAIYGTRLVTAGELIDRLETVSLTSVVKLASSLFRKRNLRAAFIGHHDADALFAGLHLPV